MNGQWRIIQPPEIVDVDEPLIYLANPNPADDDWQTRAANLIHHFDPSLVVVDPTGHPKNTPDPEWQRHYLRKAEQFGVVACWFTAKEYRRLGERNQQSFSIQHLIMAECVNSSAMNLSGPVEDVPETAPGYTLDATNLTLGRERWIDMMDEAEQKLRQEFPDIKIASSLESMCQNAVGLAWQASWSA